MIVAEDDWLRELQLEFLSRFVFWDLWFDEPPGSTEEGYLGRCKRLETLARDTFSKRMKGISVTKLEELLFSSQFDTKGKMDYGAIVSKIARLFTRPYLRNIVSTGDEICTELEDAVLSRVCLSHPHINVKISFFEGEGSQRDYLVRLLKQSVSKSDRDVVSASDAIIEVVFTEEGFEPITLYGWRDFTHTKHEVSYLDRNGLFGHDITCSDLPTFLASLILYRYASDACMEFLAARGEEAEAERLVFLEIAARGRMAFDSIWRRRDQDVDEFFGKCFGTKDYRLYNLMEKSGMRSRFLVTAEDEKSCDSVISGFRAIDFMAAMLVSGKISYIPYHYMLANGRNRPDLFFPTTIKCFNSITYFCSSIFLAIAKEKERQVSKASFFRELEREYEHACSYQSKKNVTQKVAGEMEKSIFNQYFGFVEFDEETDVEKVQQIAEEFRAIKDRYLFGIDSSLNTLRFRKLGHHKASGLYYPFLKCMCVDFRQPSSFLHEYGHLIDYTYGDLSEKCDFQAIYTSYCCYLDAQIRGDEKTKKQMASGSKYNASYYKQPTEVFARCFELYMSCCRKVISSLVPLPESFQKSVYPMDAAFLSMVENYFDKLLEEKAGVADESVA